MPTPPANSAVRDRPTVAVLGAGQIGAALLAGLSGSYHLRATVRSEERAQALERLERLEGVEVLTDNAAAVKGADVIVLAVKPQDLRHLLEQIADVVTDGQLVLSVVAAIPLKTIEARLPSAAVVRAMPNTPSLVHEGMAAVAAGARAGAAELAQAVDVLGHVGRVAVVAEDQLDAVTAVSGSGPAYFALLAEAMIEAGLLLGLSRELSTQLVVQTMLGTAKQLRDGAVHPVELRESVTSPGGTTIAAIHELEQAGVRAAFLNAIQRAATRARELSGSAEGSAGQ